MLAPAADVTETAFLSGAEIRAQFSGVTAVAGRAWRRPVFFDPLFAAPGNPNSF